VSEHWNTCPTCEGHVDAVDVYDGTELECFTCGADLVVVEYEGETWGLVLADADDDDEDETVAQVSKKHSANPKGRRLWGALMSFVVLASASIPGMPPMPDIRPKPRKAPTTPPNEPYVPAEHKPGPPPKRVNKGTRSSRKAQRAKEQRK
jgi:hypothetical protein